VWKLNILLSWHLMRARCSSIFAFIFLCVTSIFVSSLFSISKRRYNNRHWHIFLLNNVLIARQWLFRNLFPLFKLCILIHRIALKTYSLPRLWTSIQLIRSRAKPYSFHYTRALTSHNSVISAMSVEEKLLSKTYTCTHTQREQITNLSIVPRKFISLLSTSIYFSRSLT